MTDTQEAGADWSLCECLCGRGQSARCQPACPSLCQHCVHTQCNPFMSVSHCQVLALSYSDFLTANIFKDLNRAFVHLCAMHYTQDALWALKGHRYYFTYYGLNRNPHSLRLKFMYILM